MLPTSVVLEGLTTPEQQKFDLLLRSRLYDLQQAQTLDAIIHCLMTTSGNGHLFIQEYRRSHPELTVAYTSDQIISFDAPAHLLYDLVKDERVLRIDIPQQSRPT